MLVELAQAGRVRVDEQDKGLNGLRVHAVAGEPLPESLLRAAEMGGCDGPSLNPFRCL
ncbi:hypothetical protein [Streptomyces sp. NBC_00076]|uniref:hypothetical protein n=1 Tax=Streptomyces sp. NBC_00076 TaxID=2975642 RepID=UPI00324B2C16